MFRKMSKFRPSPTPSAYVFLLNKSIYTDSWSIYFWMYAIKSKWIGHFEKNIKTNQNVHKLKC